MKKLKSSLFLLLAAVLWGVAFVAQDASAETVQPFTFNATRFFIGGVVIFIISLFYGAADKKRGKKTVFAERKKYSVKRHLLGGLLCGAVLFAATNLQQYGLIYTTAGKSGFITACYIVFVPLLGLLFKRRCPFTVWIAVLFAAAGLYLMCLSEGFSDFNVGDLITLGCAVMFAAHILVIDAFSPTTDGMKIAYLQSFVCAALSGVCAFIFETPKLSALLDAYIPILYTGVFSAGIAYMFQIEGQKNLPPAVASLIMSLESVVSAVSAWIILKQCMTAREITGAAIIFIAVLIAQIPKRKKKRA